MTNDEKIDILEALLLFVIFFLVALFFIRMAYDNATGKQMIIYDRQQDLIIPKLGFLSWFHNRGQYGDNKRYLFVPAELERLGITVNVSFKAKLVMPRSREVVKKFALRQAKGTADEDLFKALQDCVASVTKIPNKVEGYPDISARAWSISNMNFHCPLAEEFGYQWAGNLEIAQCFVTEIKTPEDKGRCVELVRGR